MGAIHWPWRGPLEVHSLAVISAAVARTLEFVLARFPVGRAAQVCASRVDDKQTVRRSVDPNAVLLLPFGVHAERVVGEIADFEYSGRLEKCAWKEEAKEGDEPGAEETRHCAPYQTAAALVQLAIVGTHC